MKYIKKIKGFLKPHIPTIDSEKLLDLIQKNFGENNYPFRGDMVIFNKRDIDILNKFENHCEKFTTEKYFHNEIIHKGSKSEHSFYHGKIHTNKNIEEFSGISLSLEKFTDEYYVVSIYYRDENKSIRNEVSLDQYDELKQFIEIIIECIN